MTGRNSKPKNRGPASHPSRLEQYGDKLADNTVAPCDAPNNKSE